MNETIPMRGLILDGSQGLVQKVGYDGISFADVAERVGNRKASIYHHFPTKEDLGVLLVRRSRVDCVGKLEATEGGAMARLLAHFELSRLTLRDGRMCLCGILAAGFSGLPDPLRAEVKAALDDQETWLIGVIEAGRPSGRFRKGGDARDRARLLLGGLEGVMLLARAHDDPAPFEAVARILLNAVVVAQA